METIMTAYESKDGIINKDSEQCVKDAKNSIMKEAKCTANKVQKLFSSAGHEISNVSGKVTTEIRDNPMRSSAIALGVGVLLGALLTSSRHRA
jgi:ElaB/YqjD/DUF883 family membrane-anchored ribosome-binding protein